MCSEELKKSFLCGDAVWVAVRGGKEYDNCCYQQGRHLCTPNRDSTGAGSNESESHSGAPAHPVRYLKYRGYSRLKERYSRIKDSRIKTHTVLGAGYGQHHRTSLIFKPHKETPTPPGPS